MSNFEKNYEAQANICGKIKQGGIENSFKIPNSVTLTAVLSTEMVPYAQFDNVVKKTEPLMICSSGS